MSTAPSRTVRQSRGSTAKYVGGELMTPQMQGSRVYEQSPQSDAAGLCWASQRNLVMRPRSPRIDRYTVLSVPGWLKLGVSTTSRDVRNYVSDRVEREFCPAAPDSRWDPLTRYLKLIVAGVSVTWWV
jgi:hypothetical protein